MGEVWERGRHEIKKLVGEGQVERDLPRNFNFSEVVKIALNFQQK